MLRILCAEDDVTMRMLLRQVLPLACDDCQVYTAPTGHALLALLPVAQPDLILLDGRLPDTTGIALYDALRQVPSLREVPVLFVTAEPDLVQRAALTGASRCLPKPFMLTDLLAHVLDLLGAKDQAMPLSV